MLKIKNKKCITKRFIICKNNIFKIKSSKISKNHSLLNKSKFSKKYNNGRVYIYNFNYLKKIFK